MNGGPATLRRFPYVLLALEVDGRVIEGLEALIDTGFEGGVAVPVGLIHSGLPPDGYLSWLLADVSEVLTPAFAAAAAIAGLPSVPAVVIVVGDEPLVGRMVTDQFRVILDHDRHVLIEP